MSEFSFEKRVSAASNVMFRELEGESVILDVDSESYFGLDDVGTRMWVALTEADSVQSAYAQLQTEYDVDTETLRGDLEDLIGKLVEKRLVEVSNT